MPEDKTQRRAVIDPLLLVLKSRRVLVAICALMAGLLTIAVPEMAFVRAEVLVLLITLALALIGGYTIEDAATAARQSNPSPIPETQIRELVDAIIDALTQPQEEGSSS